MTISDLTTGATLDSSAALLAEARASRRREAAEQVRQLQIAVDYAAFNASDSISLSTPPGGECAAPLAGDGTPAVAEFAVIEFAAALGLSPDSGRHLLSQALELAHRLPRVWARTLSGEVPAWRARRISDHTMSLPRDGAEWIDAEVAPVAGKVGPVVLDRLVEEAVLRFDPEQAAIAAFEALEERHATVTIDHILDGALSTGRLDAVLDVADALELDATLTDVAAALADAGDTDPVDVRRAKALGLLARGEGAPVHSNARDQGEPGVDAGTTRRRRRRLVLHVHLSELALHNAGDGLATLKTHTGRQLGIVTVEQVQGWCAADGAQITVRPTLDTNVPIESACYQPSSRLRDLVVALNPRCVFPHCTRAADNLDLDHIIEHNRGGPTSSDNLAPLCRRHHRAKTHTSWTYTRLSDGEYLWRSPHGYAFVTDPDGTRDVSSPQSAWLSAIPPRAAHRP